MAIKFREEQLRAIEAVFQKAIDDPKHVTEETFLPVKNILALVCNKKFDFVIYHAPRGEACFAMSVQPSENYMEELVSAIFEDRGMVASANGWKKIDQWTITIDSRLLEMGLMFTPRELTALLLHEIGHIVESDTIPSRVQRAVSLKLGQMGSLGQKLFKNKGLGKCIVISFMNACSTGRHTSKRQLSKEIRADKFSAANGQYFNELISAIDKVITMQPKVPEGDTIEQDAIAGIDAVYDLRSRQIKLMDLVKRARVPKKSSVTLESVFGVSGEKGELYLCESVIGMTEDSLYCEFFDMLKKKLKPIDQSYVTYVLDKLKEIEYEDEKAMLIGYLNDKISGIDWYISILNNPKKSARYPVPQSLKELSEVKASMKNAIKIISNYKIPPSKWTVQGFLNLDLPPGYEG